MTETPEFLADLERTRIYRLHGGPANGALIRVGVDEDTFTWLVPLHRKPSALSLTEMLAPLVTNEVPVAVYRRISRDMPYWWEPLLERVAAKGGA